MLRVLWVGGYFFGTLPFIILIEFILGRVSPALWGAVLQAYYRSLCKAMRVRITVEGTLPHGHATLIVSNHVSWADIAVFSAILPVVFVAKREVSGWPLIGWAARAQKTVFVDRERRQRTANTLDEIAQRLAEGHPLILFAEGTSSDGNRVLPFRSALIGAVETARNGSLLIQPAAISYTRQFGLPMGRQMRPVAAWYGDIDFFPHFAAFLRSGAVDAVVSFGAPVAADAQADRKAMTKTLEKTVRALAEAARQRAIPIPARTR